ncbi:MAG: hypothetical protein IJJ33_07420, partial [Victivallales bacterium]|nr:hypothetical protein [Victivallales bacterium]
PLFLKRVNRPLAPTWKPDFPPSGDAIGECLENHTLEEAVTLAHQMSETWDYGLAQMLLLHHPMSNNRARVLDIGVTEALSLQFHSAENIFRFYLLRHELYDSRTTPQRRMKILVKMRDLVMREIENSSEMIALCRKDSRLGFHSEAEAHQYCPSRLSWRIAQLQDLLDTEFPEFESALLNDTPLPVSEFKKSQERYHLGTWEKTEDFQWRLRRREDGDIQLELKVRKGSERKPDDFFAAYFCDEDVTFFPWRILIRQHRIDDFNNAAQASFEEDQKSWRCTLTLPALFPNGFLQGAFMFALRRQYTPEAFSYAWPSRSVPARHRLNIGPFQPDYTGLVIP